MEPNWDDVYACYIIRQVGGWGDHYIVANPATEVWSCAYRETARRFTKKAALEFIETHEKRGPFQIELA